MSDLKAWVRIIANRITWQRPLSIQLTLEDYNVHSSFQTNNDGWVGLKNDHCERKLPIYDHWKGWHVINSSLWRDSGEDGGKINDCTSLLLCDKGWKEGEVRQKRDRDGQTACPTLPSGNKENRRI